MHKKMTHVLRVHGSMTIRHLDKTSVNTIPSRRQKVKKTGAKIPCFELDKDIKVRSLMEWEPSVKPGIYVRRISCM